MKALVKEPLIDSLELYLLLFTVTYVALIFSFYYVLWGVRKHRKKLSFESVFCYIATFTIWCIGLGVLYTNSSDAEEIIFCYGMVVRITVFFLIYAFFDISVKKNIKLMVYTLVIENIVELTFAILLQGFSPEISDDLIFFIVVLIAIWGLYFVFLRRKKNVTLELPLKIGLPFIVMMFAIYLNFAIGQIFLMEYANDNEFNFKLAYFISCVAGLCTLCGALVVMYSINVKHNTDLKYEISKQMNEQQKEYFEKLLEKEQDTRKFRHDIISELVQIKSYATAGKNSELITFLDEMLGEITQVGKKNFDVGNDIINTVFNHYLDPIREKCEIKINGYFGEDLPISDRNMCVVASNLVANAVEAVEENTTNNKIEIEINNSKLFCTFIIKNTFHHELIKNKKGLKTTKKDELNHGLGIENVKRIVTQNNGTFNTYVQDDMFVAEVILNK